MNEPYGECHKCGFEPRSFSPECPTCGAHLGFPNVREAAISDEIDALNERFRVSEEQIIANGLSYELKGLTSTIDVHAAVCVAMPANIALSIVTSESAQYVSYEKLVGSSACAPAEFVNDHHRKFVAGALFGTYGENIIYGALTLSTRGLSTYGDIFCILKQVAIDDRTSFLEINSYEFIDKYSGTSYPKGHRSDWKNKSKLVAIKFMQGGHIKKGQTFDDWEKCLLVCDGKNRNLDEFVEAHIFGSFNLHSIEKMVGGTSLDSSKDELITMVIKAFSQTRC